MGLVVLDQQQVVMTLRVKDMIAAMTNVVLMQEQDGIREIYRVAVRRSVMQLWLKNGKTVHAVVMAQTVVGRLEIKSMNSLTFRFIVLLCGFVLILFYGMLGLGAIVNLPTSWFGFLYCLAGMISGILCFIYFFKKNKVLLAIIIPAVILMIITLINMKMGK